MYLVAATLYGFAGTGQGVAVGARTGLLVVLLLAVLPFANVIGMILFLITAFTRTPGGARRATPSPTRPRPRLLQRRLQLPSELSRIEVVLHHDDVGVGLADVADEFGAGQDDLGVRRIRSEATRDERR